MPKLRVNGVDHDLDQVAATTPLLWVLRDRLDLTGTKFGCGMAQCGACTIHLDGQPARACILPLSAVGEREVTTIEGLLGAGAAALRAAWDKHQVPQCGYCQAGQIMQAAALLANNPRPSDEELESWMSTNLCRCGTYTRIRAAILEAGAEIAAGARSEAGAER